MAEVAQLVVTMIANLSRIAFLLGGGYAIGQTVYIALDHYRRAKRIPVQMMRLLPRHVVMVSIASIGMILFMSIEMVLRVGRPPTWRLAFVPFLVLYMESLRDIKRHLRFRRALALESERPR